MEQHRTVGTPGGAIEYILTRKFIKNYNLRVREGCVLLSVPASVTPERADGFIRDRAEWIRAALARQQSAPRRQSLSPPPRDEARAALSAALDRVLPLVAPYGVSRPDLRLRKMRSQWGNCHYRQGYITLNICLAACPESLMDYVALHELVHFLHHDHGPGFYARMDALMPDWKERRAGLKEYTLE